MQVSEDGKTIVVQDSDELKYALRTANGGETILLAPSEEKYKFDIWNRNLREAQEQVTIRSLDPEDPAVIDQIRLTKMTDIRFENLVFSGEPRESHNRQDLMLLGCERIEVANCTFAEEAAAMGERGDPVTGAVLLTGTTDVTISDSEFSGYLRAISHRDNTGVTITGNDFHHIQEDGIRGGGARDMTITGNVFHDWLGVEQGWLHADYIQIWSASTTLRTENLVISNNVFTGTEDSRARQVIFARNDKIDMYGGDPDDYMFRNWTITNNIIDVPTTAAIKIALIEDSLIAHNTILRNGAVQLSNSSGVEVLYNIYSKLQLRGDATGLTDYGNLALQEDDPALEAYFKTVFSNADGFRETGDTAQLALRAGVTADDGTVPGADPFLASEDPLNLVIMRTEFNYDAIETVGFQIRAFDSGGAPISLEGTVVSWDLGDGTLALGSDTILHTYAGRGEYAVTAMVAEDGKQLGSSSFRLDLPQSQVFKLGFLGGLAFDASGGGGLVDGTVQVVLDEGLGTEVIQLDQTHVFRIDPGLSTAGLPGISMEMWLQRDSAEADAGKIVSKSDWFQLRLRGDGQLHFRVTDPGAGKSYDTFIEDHGLDDADWHQIAVTMDAGDAARLYVDGALLAAVEMDWAAPVTDDPFMFGSNDTATLAAQVLDFEVEDTAWSAGEVEARYLFHMLDDIDPVEEEDVSTFRLDLADDFVFGTAATGSGPVSGTAAGKGAASGTALVVADEDYGMDVIQLDQTHVFRVDPDMPGDNLPEMSVELWLQRDAAHAGTGKIISKSESFQLRLRGDGTLHFRVIDGQARKSHDAFVEDHGLDDAGWHQIAVTMEAGDAARLYVDGALLATVEMDWEVIASDDPFMFGSRETATLEAQLSDFEVQDTAWSLGEVQERHALHMAQLDYLLYPG